MRKHKRCKNHKPIRWGVNIMTDIQEQEVKDLEAKDEAGTITDVEKELLVKLLELDEDEEDVALATQAVATAQSAVNSSAQAALDAANATLKTATDAQTAKATEVATAQAAVDATATPAV